MADCGGGCLVTKSCLTLVTPWIIAHQALLSMGFPKNTGVGCHFLPQGIFLTQGSNPHLLDRRQILYHLSHRETKEKLVFAKEKNKEGIPIKKTACAKAPSNDGSWNILSPEAVRSCWRAHLKVGRNRR